MLKKIIEKIVVGKKTQIFPSKSFDGKVDGYLLIASPEDLVELVSHPSAIPSSVLKKIIICGINRLEKENIKKFSQLKNN